VANLHAGHFSSPKSTIPIGSNRSSHGHLLSTYLSYLPVKMLPEFTWGTWALPKLFQCKTSQFGAHHFHQTKQMD